MVEGKTPWNISLTIDYRALKQISSIWKVVGINLPVVFVSPYDLPIKDHMKAQVQM